MESVSADSGSPFHAGERQIQERLGIRQKMEEFGRRVIRDHMPGQHREFYASLPFVVIGSVDERGQPWASLVAGRPGFMTTPDARTLAITALPPTGDPLTETLRVGADVGILGIQPETRRRNRMSGRVASVDEGGFSIAVKQAFGNCPQYIQTRETELLSEIDGPPTARPITRSTGFDKATRVLIENADTLFIASAYGGAGVESEGTDVSHRGGKPGFVRVENDRTFVFPDFAGNYHFNTVGNIMLNPKAGFLFVDFDSRSMAYMTGEAEIVWEGDSLRAFAGAERLIRFRADEVIRVQESLPLSFAFGDYSPMLDGTGSWRKADEIVAAEGERNVYAAYEIIDKQRESESIQSFHLRRADGKAAASYEPGQYLPLRIDIPGQDQTALRTYTLSDAPGRDYYRLSIKREEAGTVSRHFHDRLGVGDRIEAMAPRGKFVLDRESSRPVVLISAGVGITPMISMVNFIVNEGLRTRRFRRTYFIHGARDSAVHAFGEHLRGLAEFHPGLTTHVRYSHPGPKDCLGETHDSEGRVDVDLLKRILPLDDYDFYLCGPASFMRDLHDGLTGIGVRSERIRYESFGPATVFSGPEPETADVGRTSDIPAASAEPVTVHFAASGIDAVWTPGKGTLLDLAEDNGINAAFSCRSGICGTCATPMTCGAVDYLDDPSAPLGDGEVLICCATPCPSTGIESCGEDRGVVLDL